MSLVIRVEYQGTTYDLDIQEDIPLRLDISAVENTDIGEFFGVGSQIFDIPGTKSNNQFFKSAYNVGASDVPAFANTIDGRIISRGDTILKGQFQLLEVIKDEDGYVNYKCQIADETVQFKDNIQNKLIKDADWTAYQHTLTTSSIIDSWKNGLLDGNVYYPLADYGTDDPENPGNFPQFGFSNGGVGNFFDNPLTPIKPQQFLPAVRARETLEVICAQAGFSASGDFINSGNFSNLMILPKGQEQMGIVVTGSEQPIGYATNNYNQVISLGPSAAIGTILAANTIINDPLNKFNVSGSQGYVYYEADGVGTYEASAQIGFFNPMAFGAQGEAQVDLKLVRGSFPFSSTVIAEASQTFTPQDGFNTFTLNVGGSWNSSTSEELWVYVDYYTVSGTPNLNLNLLGFSSNLQVTSGPTNFVGATVDMALQWPADLKSIDIVTSLIKQFNLVVYPHPTYDKTIVFAQFDDWIREGAQKDWTEKWNTAERVAVKHTIDEEPAELLFSNADDNDRFSVEAKESAPYYQYGTLRVLADNNISQGKREIKNSFGPTVLGGPFISGSLKSDGTPTYNLDLASSFGFPHLYKFDNNQLKSYKFKPRLGYKANNSIPSGSQIVIGESGNASERVIISGSYGTLSNVNGLPARPLDDDLHFNNTYFNFVGPGLNLQNSTSNFNAYWKTYIDSLYWEDNRKITLDIKFDAQEYKDIKLNDIIFVKDQQYRINKIMGFNVTSDDVATVELIRLYPQYYQNNPNCNFSVRVEPLDCDFTFEAFAGATPTPTPAPPTPTPQPLDTCKFGFLNIGYQDPLEEYSGSLTYNCCQTGEEVVYNFFMPSGSSPGDPSFELVFFAEIGSAVLDTNAPEYKISFNPGFKTVPQNLNNVNYDISQSINLDVITSNYPSGGLVISYIDATDCEIKCNQHFTSGSHDIDVIYGSIPTGAYLPRLDITAGVTGSSNCISPTPTPSPTSTPTPTPTLPPGPTPTPSVPTPTPSPTPLPVFSYTGFAGYSNYLDACSGSATTIYTRGEIGTGSIAYEDAQLTNVFDFNRFFIDENTGIGYEFVDPNTTGQVIDTQNDACNVETFRLFISFNEYDACSDTVVNTVYAEGGSTLTNGTILYEDINLQYSWYGQTSTEIKFIESGSSPRQIYYNTATGVSASGTDVCYEVLSFDGWDSTATTPPPAYCGDTDETFYLAGPAYIGDNIFTDAALTDYIFTGEKFVYNDDENELYAMSGSTGGDGSGWVIGSITSSYCTPATPTPSPTPAPIVTAFTASYAYSSWDDACNNPAGTNTLYHAQIWDNIAPAGYEEYIYEDAALTNIFDFYVYVVDTTTGLGYEMNDPNTSGKIFATQSQVCNPNQVTIHYSFNEYDACAGTLTTTKYVDPGKNWGDAGLVMYDNFDRTQIFGLYGANEFVSTSSLDRNIYEYDSNNVLVDSGVDCYTSSFFNGSDYTSPTPPSPICGNYDETFYTQNAPQIGSVIYEDAAFTNPIFTGNNWVYNDSANELYHMSGSTGGNGTGWVIGEITSSVCTPPPTPSPTPNVQSYVMQRGYDAASQTCGTQYGTQTVYTNGPIAVGKTMYEDTGLTTNVDFYAYWRDVNTDRVWRASTLTGEVLQDLGTSVCVTPTPTPAPPTPTPVPTATPAPTPYVRWIRIYTELCTQTSTTRYYNWYGDPNTFPGYFVYDANTGHCLEVFYDGEGFNAAYDTIDCSSRFEYYNTCSDCQSGTNEQPC